MRPYLFMDDEFDAAFHNVHAMIVNGVELLCYRYQSFLTKCLASSNNHIVSHS